jgi:hypothetical protein
MGETWSVNGPEDDATCAYAILKKKPGSKSPA